MDIYSFIDSHDIAEHCRAIGQTWTPFEMAVIIGYSSRTVADKHAAWRELIADYPDMPTIANFRTRVYKSFHKKLNELMDYENREIAFLKKNEQEAFYTYRYNTADKRDFEEGAKFRGSKTKRHYSSRKHKFYTFEEAWTDAERSWKAYLSESEFFIITEIEIKKGYISAYFDAEGNLFRLYIRDKDYENLSAVFDNYVYPLPHPRYKPMLNEKERMLFYKIFRIINKWDPLCGSPPFCPRNMYDATSLKIFEILKADGGENELRDYLISFNCKKWEEVSEKLIKLKPEVNKWIYIVSLMTVT
jgi:hypothetical protein